MQKPEFDKKILLEPENMLFMYARGAFPMADKKGEIDWYLPQERAIIPLDNYNVPRSLNKFMKECNFVYDYDKKTMEVIRNCASRKETWITDELIEAYERLMYKGNVHSMEVYQDGDLVGGLYGVTYRGAFFGESMFSFEPQSSKAALVKLLERLNKQQFNLLDIQFVTNHLAMFGAIEISFEEYQKKLTRSYSKFVSFR